MNLAIVNVKGKPNEVVGYAEDKVKHDGLALEATVETIKNNTSLILKVLCEHDNKCYPLIHKAVQELSNIGLSIDKSLIMLKLDIYIDKPNDLAKYLIRVIKSDWPDEKKNLWASVFREILEDWIKFNHCLIYAQNEFERQAVYSKKIRTVPIIYLIWNSR